MTDYFDDLLMGGGGKSASFPNQAFGTTVAGVIVGAPRKSQQQDFDTQKPAFWDEAKTEPKMQLVVGVQTEARDDAEDDGVRNLYIKIPGGMQQAVVEAVRKAGVKGLRPGGYLSVTYTADGTPTRRGANPPKLYSATYTPPPDDADVALGTAQPLQTQQPAQTPQPGFQQAVQQYQQAATQPPVQPQQPGQQMQLGQQGGLPQIQPAPAQQAAPVAAPAPAVDQQQLAMAKGMAGIPGVTDEQILAAAPSVASVLQAIRAGLI